MRYKTFFFAFLTFVLILTGCTRLRFVVDMVPGEDALTETLVLDDHGGWFAPKIAMIDVMGLIVDARQPGLVQPGGNPVADYAEALQRAENDHRIHAVLVRINSPGGTVTASDVLFRETIRFRERTGKPVVILMSDLAASGGYYLACAGDTIIAHPTTITGSVGVIIQTFNVSEGMRRIGIRADAFTSGANKAAGSPLAPMEHAHRELFQGLVEEFYNSFITLVLDRRPNIDPADIDEITDGRIVTGRRALQLGLVDQLGDLHDAFVAAKQLSDLPRARLVKYHRPLEFVGSAYAHTPHAPSSQINLLQLNLHGTGFADAPGFYYLWDPVAFGTQ